VTRPSTTKHYSRKSFLETASLAIGAGLFPSSLLFAYPEKDRPKGISGSARHITLLHTSDIHGQVKAHDEFFWEENKVVFRKRGGFAHLKKLISEFRKQNPNTLLFDCGDCLQGSAIAALSKGEAIIPLLNNLGYDVILPGNWEVVYGKEKLVSNMGACKAAKVCSNMYHEQTNESIFPPYQICFVGNIKIGVIGFTDPLTPTRQSPAYSYGIKFSEPENNMAEYIRLLKEKGQCDLVIALTHLGMAQQIYLSNQSYAEGLSYIFGGDTHERIRKPIEGKFAKVMEPGAFASFIGRLDLIVEGGVIKEEAYQLLEVDPEKYEADDEMLELIHNAYHPYRNEIKKIIGKTTTPLYRYFILETPIDNLITDALMWRAKPDIALSNGFRFCPPLVPDKKTGAAEITREYLWNMLPINAEVKMGEVTGQQLCTWLEQEIESVFSKDATKHFGGWLIRFQGMKIKFKIRDDFGKRLQEVIIKGEKVDPKKTYTILACEREGDAENVLCRIKNVKNNHRVGYSLHSVIEEYLKAHPEVSPKIEGRAVATDAPATLLTQWTGTNYEFE
jgi:S-sulfosulfanyl-L-cysteine sulfohydrolase